MSCQSGSPGRIGLADATNVKKPGKGATGLHAISLTNIGAGLSRGVGEPPRRIPNRPQTQRFRSRAARRWPNTWRREGAGPNQSEGANPERLAGSKTMHRCRCSERPFGGFFIGGVNGCVSREVPQVRKGTVNTAETKGLLLLFLPWSARRRCPRWYPSTRLA